MRYPTRWVNRSLARRVTMSTASLRCPHCQTPCPPVAQTGEGKIICPHCRQPLLDSPSEDASSKRSSPWWWLSDQPSASSLPATLPWQEYGPTDAETVGGVWKPGDVILDLYEVREVFTSGGRGLVYRVRHRGLEHGLGRQVSAAGVFPKRAGQGRLRAGSGNVGQARSASALGRLSLRPPSRWHSARLRRVRRRRQFGRVDSLAEALRRRPDARRSSAFSTSPFSSLGVCSMPTSKDWCIAMSSRATC